MIKIDQKCKNFCKNFCEKSLAFRQNFFDKNFARQTSKHFFAAKNQLPTPKIPLLYDLKRSKSEKRA